MPSVAVVGRKRRPLDSPFHPQHRCHHRRHDSSVIREEREPGMGETRKLSLCLSVAMIVFRWAC